MKKNFQDRIDDHILGRMSAEDRVEFEKEISLDRDKKEQLDFTINVKRAICSREEKLKQIEKMKHYHSISACESLPLTGTDDCRSCESEMRTFAPRPNKKIFSKHFVLWTSSIAAVLVVGYLAINPFKIDESSVGDECFRGEKEIIFDSDKLKRDTTIIVDTLNRDSITTKKMESDEK